MLAGEVATQEARALGTASRYFSRLRTFFRFLVAEDLIEFSPTEKMRPPINRPDQIQPFTQEQVQALLRAVKKSEHPHRDEEMCLFLLDAGCESAQLVFLLTFLWRRPDMISSTVTPGLTFGVAAKGIIITMCKREFELHLPPLRRRAKSRMPILGALLVIFAGCGLGCGSGSSNGTNPAFVAYGYVTNHDDNTVTTYAVDSRTGDLSHLRTMSTGLNPGSILVDNSRPCMYVANESDKTVSQYRIGADGKLTPFDPPTVPTGSRPSALARGIFGPAVLIFVANQLDNTISYYRNDEHYGQLTFLNTIPSGGARPTKIMIARDVIYVLNSGDNSITTFNYVDGALGTIGTFSKGAKYGLQGINALTLIENKAGDWIPYAVSQEPSMLSQLSPDPTMALAQSLTVPNRPQSIAIDYGRIFGADTTPSGIYVGSSEGLIYQYTQGTNVSDKIAPQSAAPIAVPSQNIVLHTPQFPIYPIQHHVYAVLREHNSVRGYASEEGGLNTATMTETSTGRAPSDIGFFIMEIRGGSVQTTVK